MDNSGNDAVAAAGQYHCCGRSRDDTLARHQSFLSQGKELSINTRKLYKHFDGPKGHTNAWMALQGCQKNHAAFWPHKGCTEFPFDYKALLQYDDGNQALLYKTFRFKHKVLRLPG